MIKKLISSVILTTCMSGVVVFASTPIDATSLRVMVPILVTTTTSAGMQVSIPDAVLATLPEDVKLGLYFEYDEINKVCIAIYPTPKYCLPKKTEVGKTSVVLTNLKQGTTYTIKYKKDNTIRCITTPCPENGVESQSVEFTTPASSGGVVIPTPTEDVTPITSNLRFRSRGREVITLQSVLIQQGYMTGTATGYFGVITLKAVKDFQKAHGVPPTGYVGPLTRAVLVKMTVAQSTSAIAEKFEGTVTAYSTACFADGECSITVDGKKVVTTIGWSQMIVGKVTGIPDFGSIESNLGAHAKVYAKKTADGYTLYGSPDYYIDVTPVSKGKLPAGSAPSTSPSAVQGTVWVWQKTVMSDASVTAPQKAGVFTVTFGTDGNISGTTDCNGFFGNATFGTDGFIKFGPLGSTLMYCDGSQEQVFTGTVVKADRYSIDASGNLLFLLSGNAGTMYFVKK